MNQKTAAMILGWVKTDGVEGAVRFIAQTCNVSRRAAREQVEAAIRLNEAQ